MKFRPSMRLFAAMACVAMLVACGSSPSSPSAQGAPTAKITLGFSAWPGWFPWEVAQEQGLFAKNKV
ncbi:MAG TPA: hypothetical protein VHT50_22965, partial [Mycobacterium sp.]|nr:hypothetical protein [Mycobacterium sp.]